eukprot:CAMPEP_0119395512 /NCGR_PEP_ID=MMETSP1334-20130426/133569_1 /TAXON_ID=127549 /ORGANISM="Calcidiscus leptoporus, Strain RCC1130" /LENGTH=122 /DNA_ID=CAMNT_0007419005 /DNA_START=27 /DNA_END=391 /DNA_ORIENTATION=-
MLSTCCPWLCPPAVKVPLKLAPRENTPASEAVRYIRTLSLNEENVSVLENINERVKAQGESCSLTSKLLPACEEEQTAALQKTCALAASNSSSASASPLLSGGECTGNGICVDALSPAYCDG